MLCRKTGKLVREADALVTFRHYIFDRQWLIAKHIYIEDADWLTEEGWNEIVDVLKQEGQYENYLSCIWNSR